MKTLHFYQFILHGAEYPDYFQGCGTFCTPYTHVVTGIGSDTELATVDALEQIATVCDIPEELDIAIMTEAKNNYICLTKEQDRCGAYIHVSIRFNVEG